MRETNWQSYYMWKVYLEKMRRLEKKYNVDTISVSQGILRSHLTRTKSRTQYYTRNYIRKVPTECGQKYIFEIERSLATRLKEHQNNTKRG